jgi:hypothetical protein
MHALTTALGCCNTGATITGLRSESVESLGEELAARCGCFADGSSALGHAKRGLLKAATNGAKRHLSLLKGIGGPLVVVPFFELSGGGGGGGAVAQAYVRACLAEHCGGVDR